LNAQGEEEEESLRVHAFFDMSVLEVFVNGRTAISTRVYHPADRCYGLRFFADSIQDERQPAAVLVRAESWDGLGV
jgi:beta-fructofuranosidase